jgi:hypothetical protein
MHILSDTCIYKQIHANMNWFIWMYFEVFCVCIQVWMYLDQYLLVYVFERILISIACIACICNFACILGTQNCKSHWYMQIHTIHANTNKTRTKRHTTTCKYIQKHITYLFFKVPESLYCFFDVHIARICAYFTYFVRVFQNTCIYVPSRYLYVLYVYVCICMYQLFVQVWRLSTKCMYLYVLHVLNVYTLYVYQCIYVYARICTYCMYTFICMYCMYCIYTNLYVCLLVFVHIHVFAPISTYVLYVYVCISQKHWFAYKHWQNLANTYKYMQYIHLRSYIHDMHNVRIFKRIHCPFF